MSGKEMVKRFQKHGWVVSRIKGSHFVMKREDGATAVIPVHKNKDLHIGIQNALLGRLEEPPCKEKNAREH